jgi:hypothetical protein
MMSTTTTSFASFLFRNLEGQRLWVGIAAVLTIIQVGSEDRRWLRGNRDQMATTAKICPSSTSLSIC